MIATYNINARIRQNILSMLLLLFCYNLCEGQAKKFVVNKHTFIIKTRKVKNEWNTYDKVKVLYRIGHGKPKYILKYFDYKDDGGDCNNLFWNKEKLEVRHDSLIFTTEYFQKTGADPIPEWRKQIYKVSSGGWLILLYDKYMYRHSTEWTDQ